jgi:hypothetical protein
MAKNKDKEVPAKKSGSKATAKAEASANVTSNPRLVAAFKAYESSKLETQSYLVKVAEICQSEQLTKNEVVASMMEARGIEKSSAESQYSRMKGILTDPDLLEALRSGEIDLKTAKEKGKVRGAQKNPNAAKKKENLDKRMTKAVSQIVACAKEGGMDKASVLNQIGSALKKNGIK